MKYILVIKIQNKNMTEIFTREYIRNFKSDAEQLYKDLELYYKKLGYEIVYASVNEYELKNQNIIIN